MLNKIVFVFAIAFSINACQSHFWDSWNVWNPTNYCANVTCQNNGTCLNDYRGYHCKCQLGYNGKNCENCIDKCNATYYNYENYGFDMHDHDDFDGYNRFEGPCMNNATCTKTGCGTKKCTCLPNFTGERCEIWMDACSSSPCLNNGKCTNGATGEFNCTCATGYSGRTCYKCIDACRTYPYPCSWPQRCRKSGCGNFTCT